MHVIQHVQCQTMSHHVNTEMCVNQTYNTEITYPLPCSKTQNRSMVNLKILYMLLCSIYSNNGRVFSLVVFSNIVLISNTLMDNPDIFFK